MVSSTTVSRSASGKLSSTPRRNVRSQPRHATFCKRRRSRNQRHPLDTETVPLKAPRVAFRRWIVIHFVLTIAVAMARRRPSVPRESPQYSVSAHLRDKATARLQHPMHLGQHGVLIAHPVKRRIREHRIEGSYSIRK